jgi:hypothetical protein
LTGRLGTLAALDDLDTYRLIVDETLAGRQLDLKLFWDAEPRRWLCLRDAAGTELGCTDGERGIAFNDLVLAAGDYTIVVSGDPAPNSPYLLRLDASLAAVSSYEAEPNDTFATAGPLDVTTGEPECPQHMAPGQLPASGLLPRSGLASTWVRLTHEGLLPSSPARRVSTSYRGTTERTHR